MRKHIIVAVGLALSLAGVASAQQDERSERPRRERGVDNRGDRSPRGQLLKGITLTETQRTRIAQLHKAERDAFAAKRATRKTELLELRAARERGDTAAVKAAIVKKRQEAEQARAQRVAAIRNVLTAEQRVQFDQNVVALQQREAKRGKTLGARSNKGARKAAR